MPSYPSYEQDADSRVSWVENITTERASNGTFRGRILAQDKAEFEVVHCLNLAEADALLQWFGTYRGQEVEFVWSEDGQTYTVVCLQRPTVDRAGPGLRVVTVQLKET